MITTDAWVLYAGPEDRKGVPGELVRESYSFPDLSEHEVLVEPLYGSWQGNMNHALERDPVDMCRERGEERIVLGTAGVVRVAEVGSAVSRVREGDVCVFICAADLDEFGYWKKIHGFDAPRTVGLLARHTKTQEKFVAPIPRDTRYSLQQWAAASRYWTARSNWKVAYSCWQTQISRLEQPTPTVWGWGGGVAFAELELANMFGCRTAMISSDDKRLAQIEERGMTPIDRRQFPDLDMDWELYCTDPGFRARYKESEETFLDLVAEHTDGRGVSIFIDNIGTPVYRATVKALAREAVIATCGWKHGMDIHVLRARECINRHIHVHTHACRYQEVRECMEYQERTGWLTGVNGKVYSFDEIDQLAEDYGEGRLSTYFPIFQVNPE